MKQNKTHGEHGERYLPVPKKTFSILVVALTLFSLPNAEAQTTRGPQPSICSRSCWGARSGSCTSTITLNRAIVHHTAGSEYNTTGLSASKSYVRAIQNMDMDVDGWCDIGYHFMVDKFGNIFECRKNSISGSPRGAHDSVNSGSFGFTFMGYFHSPRNDAPTTAMMNKMYDLIAWKMPSGWSPYGSSSYGGNTVGKIDGHRKAWSTACPGDLIHNPYITSNYNGGPMRTGVANRRGAAPAFKKMAPSMFYQTGTSSMGIYRWSSTGSAFSYTGVSSFSSFALSNVGQHVAATDVNGDGKTDNVTAYQRTDGTMQLNVFLSGASSAGIWFESGTFDLSNVAGRMVGGDFNGDGKGDVAMLYDAGGGTMLLFRFLSNGSSFSAHGDTYPNSYSLNNVQDHVIATDVDGNGKDDVVTAYQYSDGTFRFHVFLEARGVSTAETWFTSGSFSLGNVGGRMVGGDFDGNGKGDVAMLYDTGGTMIVFRFPSNGSSFSYVTDVYPNGYDLTNVGKHVAAGDVTGNGKSDIVTAYQYPDGTFRYHVFLNGNGTGTAGTWFESGSFSLSNVGGRMTMGAW